MTLDEPSGYIKVVYDTLFDFNLLHWHL